MMIYSSYVVFYYFKELGFIDVSTIVFESLS